MNLTGKRQLTLKYLSTLLKQLNASTALSKHTSKTRVFARCCAASCLVGKDHRSSPTFKRINVPCFLFLSPTLQRFCCHFFVRLYLKIFSSIFISIACRLSNTVSSTSVFETIHQWSLSQQQHNSASLTLLPRGENTVVISNIQVLGC